MTTIKLETLFHYYLTTTNNDFELHYRGAELVTLAPGLRPERRFAQLARGIFQHLYVFGIINPLSLYFRNYSSKMTKKQSEIKHLYSHSAFIRRFSHPKYIQHNSFSTAMAYGQSYLVWKCSEVKEGIDNYITILVLPIISEIHLLAKSVYTLSHFSRFGT